MTGLCHNGAMTEPNDDTYLVFSDETAPVGDEHFRVRVHWARIGGRARVVGIDLRSFDAVGESRSLERRLRHSAESLPQNDGLLEVNTTVLRGLRLAEVVESSRSTILDSLTTAPPAPSRQQAAARRKASEQLAPKRQRGPTPRLNDDDLRTIVAPAYGSGGAKPVEVVREALLRSGRLGPLVTKEQARKAVAKAREKGFIPPHERSKR